MVLLPKNEIDPACFLLSQSLKLAECSTENISPLNQDFLNSTYKPQFPKCPLEDILYATLCTTNPLPISYNVCT